MEKCNTYYDNEICYPLVTKPIGVGPVVAAPTFLIKSFYDDFVCLPDSAWTDGKGVGKRHVLEQLLEELLIEGQYFVANPQKAHPENKRFFMYVYNWIAYAVLYSVVNHEPLLLLAAQDVGKWGDEIPSINQSRAVLLADKKSRSMH